MSWILIALSIIFFILVLVLITKLKVYFRYDHLNDDDHVKIEFRAWFGLIKYKIELPLIKIDNNSPTIVVEQKTGTKDQSSKRDTKQFGAEDLLNVFHDMRELLKKVVSLHKIISRFLNTVTIQKVEWHTLIGIGDAAYTGMLTGAFWAIKGSVIGCLSQVMKMKNKPSLSVTPQFQFAVSQTSISCIFSFRIGNAMLAGIKLIKYWKGGKTNFKTVSSTTLSNNKTKSI